MPITTEFITFDVGDVDCVSFFENTLDISGVVMGPAGSEWTVTIPEMPNVDLQFGVTLFCTDWTFQDGSCVRMEGDPAFTDMYIAINVRSIFETPISGGRVSIARNIGVIGAEGYVTSA